MRWWLVILLLGGCARLLGISSIHEGDDASSDGAAPGTLHVVVGGTAPTGRVTSDPAGIDCPGTCDMAFAGGTQVMLMKTDTSSDFTGFHGACSGDVTCALTINGDATVYARWFVPANIIFVSSTAQTPGGFDSIAAADTLCMNLATAAGLPQGRYLAWLSDSQNNAVMRMMNLGPVPGQASGFFRPAGSPVATMLFDLTGGATHYPPRLDEWGNAVPDDTVALTETESTGLTAPGNHCQDYASETAQGVVVTGEPAGGTGRWTTGATPAACNQPVRRDCIGDS